MIAYKACKGGCGWAGWLESKDSYCPTCWLENKYKNPNRARMSPGKYGVKGFDRKTVGWELHKLDELAKRLNGKRVNGFVNFKHDCGGAAQAWVGGCSNEIRGMCSKCYVIKL